MKQLIIVAHDIRSTHNVGSLLRTAEGLGVTKVYLTGYTPYPKKQVDDRLPHLAAKIDKQIAKTALGAERMIAWEQHDNIATLLELLRKDGFALIGLEQAEGSTPLPSFRPPEKLIILLGSEVEGISPELLQKLDLLVEIPMYGKKESFNVVEAATMAMYHCMHIAKTVV